MAVYTISDVANAVASKYDKKVVPLINKQIGLIGLMKEGQISYEGEDYFYIPWQEKMNESFKWDVEYDGTNGTLPTALSPGFQKMRLGWKKGNLQFRMSDEMASIQKGVNNFVNIMARVLDDGVMVMNLNLDAAVHQSGTGKLASAVSYSGQVVTVDTTKYLRVGMVLDGYDSSNNTNADSIVVTAINSTTTFTCTGTLDGTGLDGAVDSGTVFYHEDSYVDDVGAYAPNGISNIDDDDTGTFQNQSRDTYPQLKANIVDGSTPGTPEAFTFARMRNVLLAIERSSHGGKLQSGSFWYGTPGAINAFTDKMHDENVPTATIPKFAGDTNVPAYQYGGINFPLKSSPKAVDDTLFVLNPNYLFKYFGKAFWKKAGGSVLIPINGAPGVYGYRSQWIQFGSDAPANLGRLNDVTET